jgi:alkylhydroperoxidase/carboxymuconolactone decarboxylase family protein YurZ
MDKRDIDKIEGIIKDRDYSQNYFVDNHSKVYESFLEMAKHTFTSNKLERKVKELIAVGIAIVAANEPMIERHIHHALEHGARYDEVLEAVEVGIETGGAQAAVAARFAIKVIEYYQVKI